MEVCKEITDKALRVSAQTYHPRLMQTETFTIVRRNCMEEKGKKIFYDVHCHALNLSHAGLLAFLNRFLKDRAVSFSDLLGKGKFLQVICRLLGIHFSV